MTAPPRLRPLTVVEILDASFRLYRRNFGTFVGIFALPYLPLATLVVAVAGIWLGGAHSEEDRRTLSLWAFGGGNLVLLAVVAPFARGALIRAVGDRYLNQPTSLGRCYRVLFRTIGPYAWTVTLTVVPLLLGLGLCVAPGLLVMIWFFAAPEVCILEGKGGFGAVKRSYGLARRSVPRILGLWSLVCLLFLTLSCAVGVAGGNLLKYVTENQVLQALLQEGIRHLVTALLLPFFGVAWVLLYYDIRVREEGFDLEVLARFSDAR